MSPRSASSRGQHEAHRGDERHRQRIAEREPHAGQQRAAHCDLQAAQPEDLAPHAPQVRGLHLQADDEQEHHHAEFGHVDDGLRIVHQLQSEGPDYQPSSQIAEHGAQSQALEQGHGDDSGTQQRHDLDEFCGTAFHGHGATPVLSGAIL
jgi:hypothetical protein